MKVLKLFHFDSVSNLLITIKFLKIAASMSARGCASFCERNTKI